MKTILMVVVVLLSISLAYAQQEVDPTGGMAMPAVTTVSVSQATVRVPVQTVAQPRATTKQEEDAICVYVKKWHLTGNYALTIIKGWRLFLGLGVWHYPLDMSKTPAFISSEYQRFTEESRQDKVSRYVNVPMPEPFRLAPLPALRMPPEAKLIELKAFVPEVGDITCEEKVRTCCHPAVACNHPRTAYRPAGAWSVTRPGYREEHPVGAFERSEVSCSCGHSHTGTCPEGGHPIDGPGGGDLINTGPPVPPVPGQRN